MNQSDSERIRSVIEKVGFEMTDREQDADLIGITAIFSKIFSYL